MVKDAGHSLSGYSSNDRAIARAKLLALVPAAPNHAPSSQPNKRTKAFYKALADSLEDHVWRFL
jgi:hypothetical protein